MPKVVVCGLGQVGFRTVELLLRLGAKVTVVTQHSREEFVHTVQEHGARVINGDGRSDANLKAAGIEEADSFIAAADSDVTNIEVCLDAARLNPRIRVVARLFDQSLGKRLEATIGLHRTFAMSALSAPAFAAAAFGEAVRGSFLLGGKTMMVGEVPGSPKLAEYAEVGKVCVLRATMPNGDVHLAPEAAKCTLSGARYEVACTKERFLRLSGVESITTTQAALPRKRSPRIVSRLRETGKFLRAIWENTPASLKIVALSIFGLGLVSVFVFQIGKGLSPIDSLYFVTTTLTTTGYGDISLKDDAVWIKLYGILLLLLGSATVATMYSILTDFIVSTRFDQVLGRQRVTSDDHVIVVGLSNVGYRTQNELRLMGIEAVVIDVDANCEYRSLLDRSTPFINGDARDSETLKRAGIESATAVVSTTGDDSVNLSVALTAKSLNPSVRAVVRIFDPDFARKIQQAVNVDAAMSATRVAAPSFVGSALFGDSVFSCVVGDSFAVFRADGEDVLDRKLSPTHELRCQIQEGQAMRVGMYPMRALEGAP